MKKYLPEGLSKAERTALLNKDMRNSTPAVCLERARIITRSNRENESCPVILRRARGLADILEQMTIFIGDNELIVGNHASRQRNAPLYPEMGPFSDKELDLMPVREVDRLQITESEKEELRNEIYPYWKGRCLEDLSKEMFPQELYGLMHFENRIFDALSRTRSGYGHYLPNIRYILNHGFSDLDKRARQKLKEIPPESTKADFYQAVLIICQAVRKFAGRYGALAREQMLCCNDGRRKKELALISGVCEHVPWYPATNFHEAIQSYWFTLLIDYIFQNGSAISCGRFDQFMFPFYKKDLENGTLDREEAQEFIEALWVKHNDVIKACTYSSARNNGGFSTSAHLILGGVDKDGQDAANDLTFLCLEADRNVFNCEPNIGIRISEKSPDALVERIFDILADKGGGKYPLFNDEIIIKALVQDGLPLEEARDYAIVGCVEPSPYGNSLGISNACYFNLAKCLELALNEGRCMLSGKQVGPATLPPEKMQCFDDVLHAFEIQTSYFVEKMTDAMNVIEEAIATHAPHIYCSLLLDGCMESGLDSSAGGSVYNYCGVQGVGIPDVGDSLAAIQQIVFNEKLLNMDELRCVLLKNFRGDEMLRQILINKAPKYGNDLDAVDLLVRYVGDLYCDEVAKHKEWRGGKFRPGLYCVSANTPIGRLTGALPNGRKARTPLADGGISPKHGMDLKGPTAVFKSASKINLERVTNGVDLNMKLLPTLANTPRDRDKLVQLIRGYFALSGMHVQFNILSDETLKAAQKYPQEYKNLVVRVAGYSAFFIDLDKDIQDEIITRQQH